MQAGKPSLTQICFVAIAVILTFRPARAQTDLNDVHIAPRVQSDQPDALGSVARTTTGIIRTTVELVLVPVTVLDGSNRIVAGLERENFQVYEDKHPQPIKHFWKEDAPISVGSVTTASRARSILVSMLPLTSSTMWPRILSRLKTLLETGTTFRPHLG